jgi:hypothetical protein
MSNSNNDNCVNEYQTELENIEKKLENLKNPDSINIDNNVDEDDRKKFYEKIKDIPPNKVISFLANCGELQNDHDFWRINENVVKHQIKKLENLKLFLTKKINKNDEN